MIAIIGGSFDPVHKGHIYLAKIIKKLYKTDIYFIPAQKNPLKKNAPVASAYHRKNMLELAIKEAHLKRVFICEYELENDTPSYSINTLNYIIRKIDPVVLMVIGSDAFLSLPKWHKANELVRKAKFLVIQRGNLDYKMIKKVLIKLSCSKNSKKWCDTNFEFLRVPILPYSASNIRRELKKAIYKPKGLFNSVWKYIKKNKLYSV